jgi:hypothetical protein
MVGPLTDTGDSSYLNAVPITTGNLPAHLVSVSVNVGAIDAALTAQSYQVAVYTNTTVGCPAGVTSCPGMLLASSPTGTLRANSWNTLAFATPIAVAPPYWLVYNTNGTTAAVNNVTYAATGGIVGFAAAPFGTWPAVFPVAMATFYSRAFSIYATLLP